MSAAQIEAGIDEHPEWCQLGPDCHDGGGAARHLGRRSVWAATSRDDVQLALSLERGDDDVAERLLRGQVAVALQVTNTSTVGSGGRGLLTCTVVLSADEARRLADNLNRYAVCSEEPYASLARHEISIDGLTVS